MTSQKLFNFVSFQIGWFACVLGAANGVSEVGLSIAMLIIALHLFLTKNKSEEVNLIVCIALIGYSWDSLLVHFTFIQYADSGFSSFAPLWIASMWAMFATTINSSMSWLKERILLSAFLGALFGPIAYYSAYKLGAIDNIMLPDALIAQCIVWAALMPLMLQLNKLVYRKHSLSIVEMYK